MKRFLVFLPLIFLAFCSVVVGMDTSIVHTDTLYHYLTFEEAIAGLQSVISGNSGVILRLDTAYAFSWQYGDNIAFAFLDTAKGALVFKDWSAFMQELFPRATASVHSASDLFDYLLNAGYKEIDAGELPMKIVSAVNAAAQYMVNGGLQIYPTFILCPAGIFDIPQLLQLEPERT
jgi:hypothetical protein